MREGIHVDKDNEEEIQGSKGTANFVMKWKDSKREASISVAEVKGLGIRNITGERPGRGRMKTSPVSKLGHLHSRVVTSHAGTFLPPHPPQPTMETSGSPPPCLSAEAASQSPSGQRWALFPFPPPLPSLSLSPISMRETDPSPHLVLASLAPPQGNWYVESTKGTKFEDVDLSEGEWTDYCEKLGESVGIYK